MESYESNSFISAILDPQSKSRVPIDVHLWRGFPKMSIHRPTTVSPGFMIFGQNPWKLNSRNSNNSRIRWIMRVWTCIIERDNPYLDVKKKSWSKNIFLSWRKYILKILGGKYFFSKSNIFDKFPNSNIFKIGHFKIENLKIENFQKLSPQNEKSSLSKLVCFRPYSIQSMPIAS